MREPPVTSSIPRFRPGVRLQFDEARQRWSILAPERLFVPDEQALEVLQLIDATRDCTAIAEELALRYDAAPGEIGGDVATLLSDLAGKGILSW